MELIYAGMQGSCTRKEKRHKPNSEELRATFPMSWQIITTLPADYSALHGLNILLSAPVLFCCKLTILTSICFPGFPSRFPLKKKQKTFWREVCHLERKGEENRRRTDSLPLIPMATQSGQIIWGFNTQSLSFMKGLKRWCFYQLPKYAIFRSALLLLSLFHLQVPLLGSLAFNLGI